ncbi:transcriptional initiation protein Tat [Vibrio sp. SCSIO 43136]|uniref:transcriptional initiation protein Tat n=1 Tax=Vibrio sp. SCSIO 43136 TaxID=2819101 RepID=UPI002076199C|nr:transcriptional initiation protein Tat [Vibrio sp. SCSIO 43136]USD66569.1 transcriptional initiation protein Tat [Vibrio sp. SCSIO 43136]
MSNEKQVDSSKRDLLKGIATAAVTATVATAATKASASPTTQTTETKKVTGYHETQHIRDYYDSL